MGSRLSPWLVAFVCVTAGGNDCLAQPSPTGEAPRAPRSSDFLALLPDGEEKRRFLLDCTNCHTFDRTTVTVDGAPRDRRGWVGAVERMLSYAGAETGFPVIGPGRDAEATADWLLRHLGDLPTGTRAPTALPEGAEVEEFLLPVAEELPHDVAVLPDGGVLVTGMFTHRMWVLDPPSGTWDEEPIPVAQANPRAVLTTRPRDGTPDGADWWVLLGGPHRLAHRDAATGAWRSWDVGFYGHSVDVDPRGRVWFNSHFSRDPGVIGFVDPADGRITRFHVDTPADVARGGTPIPYGLRIAPDGTAWGTELRGNRIVSVDPESGRVRTLTMPLPVSGPRRPDFDGRGDLWIPEYAGNALTRFDRATETFHRHPLPVADALPYVVRVDRDRVWVGTATADAVFLFEPGEARFTAFPLPSRGAMVRHMDVDERSGDVWLAYGASPGIPARIARLRPGAR